MIQKLKRYWPILLILILTAIVYFTGLYKVISFEALKHHYRELQDFADSNPIGTPLAFMAIYIVSTALSLPGGLFLSFLGGFLFPQPFCTLYVVIGATIGAVCLFLAARTALGKSLKKKAGPWLSKLEAGFRENEASYMLFLRLVPFVPFWLVNLAPAFFNTRLRTYIWTTLIGIAPGAFVNTQIGRGLGAIFESEVGLTFNVIFNTEVKIALTCLGFFALIPIAIKKWRARKRK